MSYVSSSIRGIIIGYRKSRARQYCNQVLVKLFTDPKNVARFIGADVVVKDFYNNIYRGRVVRVHSYRNCVVIARFKPNIPGQAIGLYVDLFKT
ncbi:MAG: 50S ribosomal protein L35ae [Ignisphaera sp.]